MARPAVSTAPAANPPTAGIAALQAAAQREPRRADRWFELGRALLVAHARDAALPALDRAVALAPDWMPAVLQRGRCHLALGDLERAQRDFERALALAPDDAGVAISIADVLLYRGDVDAAAARLRAVLAREPGRGAAWWSLANLKTREFTADELAALETAHAAAAAGPDRDAMGFALGTAYEAAGRHADALAVLDDANAAVRARLPWDRDGFRARVDRLLERFAAIAPATGDALARDATARGTEVIFVIGVPRSGSTLVEQTLAAHPDVAAADELADLGAVIDEESHRRGQRYPEWLGVASAADWRRLGRRYLDRTAKWRREKPRMIDKMPNNWLYLGAALAMLPGARVVDCRRDAFETAWSCYKQLFSGGAVFAYAFDDIATWIGAYRRTVDACSARAPGRIHRVELEALARDPEREARALFAHCGLAFDPAYLDFHAADRDIRTPSSAQVRQPLAAPRTPAANYGPLLDPLRRALADA